MADQQFHLHLISDSTGETVQAVARAVCAQFVDAAPQEHIYGLVRGSKALARALEELKANPGPVMYSILDDGLRSELHAACDKIGVPCLSLLQPFVNSLAPYLKVEIANKPGSQHALDTDYFHRINALNYTIQHDDGQSQGDLNEADIVLTGVSRTSKTPTCIYLANKGIKAANVTLNEDNETEYNDPELIRGEVAEARRLFTRQKWPVIDVTRRSVEEIASAILNLYQDHEKTRHADK